MININFWSLNEGILSVLPGPLGLGNLFHRKQPFRQTEPGLKVLRQLHPTRNQVLCLKEQQVRIGLY